MNVARRKRLSEEDQQLWERFTQPIKGLKRDKQYHDPFCLKRKVTDEDQEDFENRIRKLYEYPYPSSTPSLKIAGLKTDSSFFIQHYKLFKEKQGHAKDTFTAIGERKGGLDNATWKRLQKGDIKPEWTLDLHGFVAQQAFIMLEEFLVKAYRHHIRCVDVITGIGTGYKEGGILKKELPHWLNRPYIKTLILATLYVSPQNGGAVRILLKRNR